MEYLCVLAFVALVCAFTAGGIAEKKNAGAAGWWLGLLFGPLGVLIAVFLDNRPQCPMCRSRLDSGARICPFCRQTLGWVTSLQPVPEEELPGIIARLTEEERLRRTKRMEDKQFTAMQRAILWRQLSGVCSAAFDRYVAWFKATMTGAWALLSRLVGEENRILLWAIVVVLAIAVAVVIGAGLAALVP